MILKAEPCLEVSIQNQLILGRATMIVWQIPVARNRKLIQNKTAEIKRRGGFNKKNKNKNKPIKEKKAIGEKITDCPPD